MEQLSQIGIVPIDYSVLESLDDVDNQRKRDGFVEVGTINGTINGTIEHPTLSPFFAKFAP